MLKETSNRGITYIFYTLILILKILIVAYTNPICVYSCLYSYKRNSPLLYKFSVLLKIIYFPALT